MKKAVLLVMACLLAQLASANLLATEIMYNPSQADDTDAEWVEIYNDGNEAVNLSGWQMNGKSLSGTIPAGSYLVVARELLDGSDADSDSFESIWGNADGTWDAADGFLAVQGGISLSNTAGAVNLTNGIETEYAAFESSWGANGNGRSLERINLTAGNSRENWNESADGGSPGKANSISVSVPCDEVEFDYEIANVAPLIRLELSPDDMAKEGVQVIANGTSMVVVTAYVSDENGFEDVLNVTAEIEGRAVAMQKTNGSNETLVFIGSIAMRVPDEKREYSVTVTAFDSHANSTASAKFDYIGTVATVLETRKVSFGNILPGNVSETQIIAIRNTGTVAVRINVTAANGGDNIEALAGGEWKPLAQAGFAVQPEERLEISLRVNAPKAKAERFGGRIRVVAVPA